MTNSRSLKECSPEELTGFVICEECRDIVIQNLVEGCTYICEKGHKNKVGFSGPAVPAERKPQKPLNLPGKRELKRLRNKKRARVHIVI